MYYIDRRTNTLFDEKMVDLFFLAPELYYELCSSESDCEYIEEWEYTENNETKFCCIHYEESYSRETINEMRSQIFDKYKPYRLQKYYVPEQIYSNAIAQLNSDSIVN